MWRTLLRRISARFPGELHPDVMVENLSMFMRSPTAEPVETKREISFELSEDEEPFARGIVEEIRATFPDHELMLPEVGQVILPDVNDLHDFGEVTLFDCLFTEQR